MTVPPRELLLNACGSRASISSSSSSITCSVFGENHDSLSLLTSSSDSVDTCSNKEINNKRAMYSNTKTASAATLNSQRWSGGPVDTSDELLPYKDMSPRSPPPPPPPPPPLPPAATGFEDKPPGMIRAWKMRRMNRKKNSDSTPILPRRRVTQEEKMTGDVGNNISECLSSRTDNTDICASTRISRWEASSSPISNITKRFRRMKTRNNDSKEQKSIPKKVGKWYLPNVVQPNTTKRGNTTRSRRVLLRHRKRHCSERLIRSSVVSDDILSSILEAENEDSSSPNFSVDCSPTTTTQNSSSRMSPILENGKYDRRSCPTLSVSDILF